MNVKTHIVSAVCVAGLVLIGTLPVIAKDRRHNSKSSLSNQSAAETSPSATKPPLKNTSITARKKGEQPQEVTAVSTPAPKTQAVAKQQKPAAPKATPTAPPKTKTYDFSDPEVIGRTKK